MNTISSPVNILIFEAYDDGSHGSFLDGLTRYSQHNFVRLSLPGRKWKWRMRGSAIYFAREMYRMWPAGASFGPDKVDIIFTSDMTSVTDLKALLAEQLRDKPFICYFHENQLTYPLSEHDEIDYQYGFTNITSALAAEGLWFNSEYNRTEFVAAANALLRKMPDYIPERVGEDILEKSIVMPLGMPPELFGRRPDRTVSGAAPAVILWNHRWEYDKNPDSFFQALYRLDEDNIEFRLIVAGQSFRTSPKVFGQARERLAHKTLHWGYAQSREHYIELLGQSDIVVSTAIHEFFGLAVMEAVSCGCTPLLPNRLNYPYLVPLEYHADLLYNTDDELLAKLKSLLQVSTRSDRYVKVRELADKLNWTELAKEYDMQFVNVWGKGISNKK